MTYFLKDLVTVCDWCISSLIIAASDSTSQVLSVQLCLCGELGPQRQCRAKALCVQFVDVPANIHNPYVLNVSSPSQYHTPNPPACSVGRLERDSAIWTLVFILVAFKVTFCE